MKQPPPSKERTIVKDAANKLVDILSTVPFLKQQDYLAEINPDHGCDLRLNVIKNGKRSKLAIDVRSNAQLRDARLAAEKLRSYCSHDTHYPVFCSQYLSPPIRAFCVEAGLSYFDFAGNYRLIFGDVFIEREAPSARPLEKKRLRSLFAPMAARVLRRLFTEPQRPFKVMSLADEAGVSPATVSLLKDKLIGEEYVRAQGEGFVLQRPTQLLKAWSSQYRYKDNQMLQFYSREPKDDIEKRFASYCRQHGIEYGFTLFSGASRVTAFTRGVTQSHAYVPSREIAIQIADSLELKLVDSGGSFCLLLPADDDLLFSRQEIDEELVVSDIQLYLDLASHPSRGEESAEYLLEQRLQSKW